MTEIYLLHCTRAYRLTEKILILRVNYIIPYSLITNFKRSLKVKLAKMVLPGFNTKGQNKTNKLADIYKAASTNMRYFSSFIIYIFKGAGSTGTAASWGLCAQANALQRESAGGTCTPPGPARDNVGGQKMAKGNGAGPRLTLQCETHQGAALGISRQDGRVTDRAQPCRPRCQRGGSGTDR